MRFRLALATVLAAWGMGLSAGAQQALSGDESAPATTKGILQPAVMSLQQTMDSLRVEKWKASKSVKAAATENIGSIRRDVEGTLPGLVTAADAAPGSLSAILPLSRNVGALYDVTLRVAVIAESAAPDDQADAIEKSLNGLESARRTLFDHMRQMAAAEEAKAEEARKQLNARAAVAAVCPPSVPAAAAIANPTAKAKRKKKAFRPGVKSPASAAKPSRPGAS